MYVILGLVLYKSNTLWIRFLICLDSILHTRPGGYTSRLVTCVLCRLSFGLARVQILTDRGNEQDEGRLEVGGEGARRQCDKEINTDMGAGH